MFRFIEMEEKMRILEDLNMIYIRQIAMSLQDTDIQKKIDHEIRMRDGTCKLLAACSQKDQALEAAKGLLTCNARILAYMSELQRMKEAQVMQRAERRPSDASLLDDRLPCKGKVAISDLRIPLMWKDTEYFKNKGELHRCAVFCVVQLGGQIFDTDMVMVDRTLTDICFENTIVFNDAGPGFELRVELYSCCTEEEFSVGNAPRKLANKLSSSLGRSSGKKVRAALEQGACSPVYNGGGAPLLLPTPSVPGPKYHLLAHTSLTLAHVRDTFRTHDLTICGNDECSYWLPLYGSVCCRLAAQPDCMTQEMMSGSLKVKLGEDPQSWTDIYGVLRGTHLICYHRQEDKQVDVEPAFTIVINKDTRIRATEKDPLSKLQSISISNHYGGEEVTHTVAAGSREDTQRWMEAFWQQFYDMTPTIKHELALTKLQLEAEKERGRLREETIAILKSDKDYLQQELAKKDEFMLELLKTGNRSMDPSSSGESSKIKSEPKRIYISDDDSETASTLPFASPLSDSSLEDDSKKKKKHKKRSILPSRQLPPKFSGSPRPETSRVRVKNCRDIIRRYKAALEVYSEGRSMKAAFEHVGVDRNTISRTAVIAELSLAAPEVFKAIGQWNEKAEKLSTFVDKCRSAITTEIKDRISEMKENGQWKQCCDNLMKIEVPSPRKPTLVTAKQGSLYHEMVIDTTEDLETVTDIWKRHMHEFELHSQLGTTPHWMSLYEEVPGCKAAGHSPQPSCRTPRSLRHSPQSNSVIPQPYPCCSWPEALPPWRPCTLSLDTKLGSFQGSGYGGQQCRCQVPASPSTSSCQPPQQGLSSTSTSTCSNSSTDGSTTSDSDSVPLPRSSLGYRSLVGLQAKLAPCTWLQTQV